VSGKLGVFVLITVCLTLFAGNGFAQKMGYVNSQQIIANFKEAQDAQERMDKINREWQQELMELQKQFQDMNQQLESQSLLLSEERQKEKREELRSLYLKAQQFQDQKWGQNGESFKKQDEIMKPVIDKINAAIKKVGEELRYDYIFDTVAGNILYASPSQTDLTEEVLAELEKGVEKTKK
jgi:outer membrane protein